MLYSRICRPRFTQAFLVLVTILCLSSQLCLAEPYLSGNDRGRSSRAADDQPQVAPKISPAEAADLVRNKMGGQVMSVKTQHGDTGVIYHVKVLNAGRMRVIRVDGQSGHILKK